MNVNLDGKNTHISVKTMMKAFLIKNGAINISKTDLMYGLLNHKKCLVVPKRNSFTIRLAD